MEKTLLVQTQLSKGKQEEGVFSFSTLNEDLAGAGAGSKGTLAFLLTLSSNSLRGDEASEEVIGLAKAFEEAYLGSKAGTILESLDQALKELKTKADEKSFQIEIVSVVVWGLVLYIGKLGEGQIVLHRSGASKKIEFNFVASGMIKDADILVLTNSQFSQNISLENLGQILDSEEPEEIKKKLDQVQESLSSTQALVLKTKLEERAVEEVPISFVDADKKLSFSKVKEVLNSQRDRLTPLASGVLERSQPARSKIFTLGTKVWEKIIWPWRKRKAGEVFDEKARKKARLFQVVGVLVIALVFSLWFSFGRTSQANSAKKTAALITQAKAKVEQAKTTLAYDPSQTSQLLSEAQSLLKQVKPDTETKALENQISQLEKENQKIFSLANLQTLADLGKLKAKPEQIAVVGNSIFSLDSSGNLVKSDINSGQTTLLKQDKNLRLLAAENKTVYLVGGTSVFSLNTDNGLLQEILNNEGSWQKPSSAAVFSENLYLLDPAKEEIWKHFGSSGGIGRARSYLSADKPELSGASALAVDGNVWVGTTDGKIYKFLAGKKQDFSLKNGPGFSSTYIFTNADSLNLYILDKKEGHLLVFDKSGLFKANYEDSLFKSASSLVVDENGKTVYFGSANKIYKFKIK